MGLSAHVGGLQGKYVATLSDGRQLEGPDLIGVARVLHFAGIPPGEVSFELRPARRLLTSGQQVALCAEIRRLATHQPSVFRRGVYRAKPFVTLRLP